MAEQPTVTFEEIVPGYSRGHYGDFEVIIQTATGYVNATRLCKQAATRSGKPRAFAQWNCTLAAQALKKAVAAVTGVPVASLTVEVRSRADDIIRGTYVRPDLLPHIAMWASVEFAIRVANIVEAYLVCKAVAAREKQLLDLHGTEMQRAIECIDTMARSLRAQSDAIVSYRRVEPDTAVTASRAGYVYVVMTSEYPWNHEVKIGRSADPERRVKDLQTGNAAQLRVYKQFYSLDCCALEESLHRRCQAWHVRGEWFRLTLSQIHEFTCDIVEEGQGGSVDRAGNHD